MSHTPSQASFFALEFGTQSLFVGCASSVNSFMFRLHVLVNSILTTFAQFFPVRVHASAHCVAVRLVGTKGLPVASTRLEIALLTEGCSGAEVVSICQEAALLTMKDDIDAPFVPQRAFVVAAKGMKKQITPDVVQNFHKWGDTTGLQG